MDKKNSLNYNLEIYQIETTDGIKWIAKYPTLKGAVGGGDTQEEALESLKEAALDLIDFMQEEGEEIPVEFLDSERKYSGRITVRTSKTQHRVITELAEKEGISINQLVNEAIGYMVGSKLAANTMVEGVSKLIDNLGDLVKANTSLVTNIGSKYTLYPNPEVKKFSTVTVSNSESIKKYTGETKTEKLYKINGF